MTRIESTPDLEDALDTLDVGAVGVIDPIELREIASAVDAQAAEHERVIRAVSTARKADFSWGLIGIALGTSRQAAHERYSKLVG